MIGIFTCSTLYRTILNGFSDVSPIELCSYTMSLRCCGNPTLGSGKSGHPPKSGPHLKKMADVCFTCFFNVFFTGVCNGLNLPTPHQPVVQDKRLRCPLWIWVQLGAVQAAEVIFWWWCFGVKTHDGLVGLVEISEKTCKNPILVVVSLWMSPQFFLRQKYLKDTGCL